MEEQVIYQTELKELPSPARGKVRDIYDLGDNLLIVATDRLSAFDVVMRQPIPGKGKVLTAISHFWFQRTQDIVTNHLISMDVADFPAACRPYAHILEGRSMLVQKAKPLPIECIVRGYLTGSGYKDYLKSGRVCGHPLPAGLQDSERLPQPLFTPSTKADQGEHDQNITLVRAVELAGREWVEQAAEISLKLYARAAREAEEKGIIVADTKFEFGIRDNRLVLIDEALTPDSSRFWPKDRYQPGRSQPSFDKQYVRDYLSTLAWDKTPPPPDLPDEVVRQTALKYREALSLITGQTGSSGS